MVRHYRKHEAIMRAEDLANGLSDCDGLVHDKRYKVVVYTYERLKQVQIVDQRNNNPVLIFSGRSWTDVNESLRSAVNLLVHIDHQHNVIKLGMRSEVQK